MNEKYPEELLPKAGYQIIPTSKLPSGSYLARRSFNIRTNSSDIRADELLPHSVDRKGITKINYRALIDYSTSLWGVFNKNHIKFRPTDAKQTSGWKPGDELLKAKNIKFDLEKPAIPIFFPIDSIHNCDFPYKKTNGKNTEIFQGKVEVEHAPTKCNYWHYIFKMFSEDGVEIKSGLSKAWVKDGVKTFYKFTFKIAATKTTPKASALISKEIYVSLN